MDSPNTGPVTWIFDAVFVIVVRQDTVEHTVQLAVKWDVQCSCNSPSCIKPLRWCHNGRYSISNHQLHDCLLNRLFRCRSKKTSKLHVTGLCAGNSPGTGEFPAQMASNVENVSIWWRHHANNVWRSLRGHNPLISWSFVGLSSHKTTHSVSESNQCWHCLYLVLLVIPTGISFATINKCSSDPLSRGSWPT